MFRSWALGAAKCHFDGCNDYASMLFLAGNLGVLWKEWCMRKIIVMNTKGGCGKTTVATNLASLYVAQGYKTALLDYDPQGSSSTWLKRRAEAVPAIHGVVAYQASGWNATRSWQMRMPQEIERVIVDTPAAIKSIDVLGYLKDVDTIVVPVLSSVIDVEAVIPFIQEVCE
jgi:chromosome partitioning protein